MLLHVQAFLEYNTPRPPPNAAVSRMPLSEVGGRAYESTLLGAMLSVSCLPARGGGAEEGATRFFERPSSMSQSLVENMEAFIQPVGAFLNPFLNSR